MPVPGEPGGGGPYDPLGGGAQLDFRGEAVDVLPGIDATTASSPRTGFAELLGNIMSISMVIAAILLLLYFIWGAIEWTAAGGDKSKIEKARGRITNAVTGIIVLSSTAAVIMIIQGFLGIQILTFTGLWSPDYGGGGTTGYPPGGGGGGGNGGGGSSGSCTPSNTLENDGAAGRYCRNASGNYSPAMVRCNAPDDHLPYNHYDPCYCLEGGTPIPGYDFDTC